MRMSCLFSNFAVMCVTMCKILLLTLLLMAGSTLCLHAQELARDSAAVAIEASDSTLTADTTATKVRKGVLPWLLNYFRNSNKERGKRFDYSVTAGPFYDSKSSLSIGGGISALYSWDRSDPELRRSVMSIMGKLSIKGMVGVEVSGMNYMRHDKSRWNYKLKFSTNPMNFWGIGYDHGINDAYKGEYKQIRVQFKPDYLFRLASNFYVGPTVNLSYTHTYKFTNRELVYGQDIDILATGAGVVLNYDSRDYSTNAYKGRYLRVEQLFYPKFTNKYYFNSTDLSFSTYHGVWKAAVLAIEFHSQLNYGGDVPWTMLAQVAADNNRMRGYYEGRYRDRNIMEAQLEVRQRLPKRCGVVAFVGAANVFRHFNDINMRQTLPNYGVGARWELKQRVNLRLDFGFTKNKPGVVFNINEAF